MRVKVHNVIVADSGATGGWAAKQQSGLDASSGNFQAESEIHHETATSLSELNRLLSGEQYSQKRV